MPRKKVGPRARQDLKTIDAARQMNPTPPPATEPPIPNATRYPAPASSPTPIGPSATIANPDAATDPASAATATPSPEGLIALELGRTGLTQYYGRVVEEFLPELQYERGRRILREMSDNDPTIGALLAAITMLVRSVEWRVESDKDDDPRAEFIDQCRDDMAHTWEDLIAEIIRGVLVFGWSFHEIVYKLRHKTDSQYNDQKIGWKKMPLRSQESLWRWDFKEDTQSLKGLFQRPPPDFRERYVPLEKALLFRNDPFKANPEGRSALRNAYRPWYFKKHIEQIEAIGVERDLAGMPILYVPARLLESGGDPGGILTSLQKMIVNVRRDEMEGVILPQQYDPETKMPLYEFKLLASAGQRQLNTSEIITRWDVRILITVLVDFIIQGHDQVGSFSMTRAKIDFFNMAMRVWLDNVAAVFNRYAIPRLLELNGMDSQDAPYLEHGDVERRDLQQLGDYLNKIAAAGMPLFPDPKLENVLRDMADLPTLTPEELDVRTKEDEAQALIDEQMQQATLDAAKLRAQGGAPAQGASANTPGSQMQAAQTEQADTKKAA